MGQCAAKEEKRPVNGALRPVKRVSLVTALQTVPEMSKKCSSRSLLKQSASNVLKVGAVVLLPPAADDRLRPITTQMHTAFPKYGTVTDITRNNVTVRAGTTRLTLPLASFPQTVQRLCPHGCCLSLSIVPAECTLCGAVGTHVRKCTTHKHTLCQYCSGVSYLPLVGSKVVKGPTYAKRNDLTEGLVLSHPKGHGMLEVRWDGGHVESLRGPPFQDIVTAVVQPKDAYSVTRGFRFNQMADSVQEKSVRSAEEPITVMTREVVSSADCHEFRVVLHGRQSAVGVVGEDSPGLTESGVTMLSSDSGVSFMRDGKVVHESSGVLEDKAEVVVKVAKNTAEFSWHPDREPECFNLPKGNFRFGVQLGNAASVLIKDSWRPPAYKWTDIDLDLTDPGRVLGEGAHGVVYRAKLKGEPVAVKVLKKGIKGREEQYTREVDALAAVRDSPYNLKLVGVIPNACGIITELCEGTLRDYLGGEVPNVPEALRYAREAASGMQAVVEAGLVHCDLNCNNVFVAMREGVDGMLRPTAVVGDYGMTLAASQVQGRRGSLMYMAPELFEGKVNSAATDIFSYAVVLRFLFTGTEPTPADYTGAPPLPVHLESITLRGKSAQVASGVISGMRPSVPSIPQGLGNLINSCWAGDPMRRPSFAAILKTLEYIGTPLVG